MLTTVIIFIVTLLVLVVVHELGHFLMAKKFNIKVLEFGFGIPPRAWGRKFGETIISLNWLPFGGFVHLLGEDEVNRQTLENHRSFAAQNVWKRIAVVVAGVVMNLVLAWALLYIVLGSKGFNSQIPLLIDYRFLAVNQRNEDMVLVSGVAEDSPAQQSGIKAGSRILAINGQDLKSSQDLINRTKELSGGEMTLLLSDPEQTTKREVKIIPRKNPPEGQGPLGVNLSTFKVANLSYDNPWQKILSGPIHSYNLTAYSASVLGFLINLSIAERTFEPVSTTVSGPVGIVDIAGNILTSSEYPLIPYLNFIALLSLNLAVLNILPFPALDGGRLFFLALEAIARKRVHPEVEKWVHSVGMAILLTLIALITFSDIRKLLF